MKEGDKARSKRTQYEGTIAGFQTRLVDGKAVIERVLLKAAPGSRLWLNVDEVELVADTAGESP